MKFFKASGMQAIDRQTIEEGTPGETLMSRACRILAGELMFFAERDKPAVRILCGPGNNGGDGFGLAWHLHQAGWPVEVWLCVPPEKIRGDALLFYQRCLSGHVPLRILLHADDWPSAENSVPPSLWWVDALLGTGTDEAPRGNLATAVQFLRAQAARNLIWSVDLPSGLNPDNGQPFDPALCVRADHTLTLGGPKIGFSEDQSDQWTGTISILDLGFPDPLLNAHGRGDWLALSDREATEYLPTMPRWAHKGSQGHALLIGGSPGMSGSIILSARAALASGCGLVTVLTPYSCAPLVDAAVPEAMVLHGLQGNLGSLCSQEINFSPFQSVGMGPGLRVNYTASEMLSRVLKECHKPLVLDADALTNLGNLPADHREYASPLWMTPHPGEMGRLLKCTSQEIQASRSAMVEKTAAKYRARVLLKGARSRIVQPDAGRWINLNGNPGMATGGSGDVLTGLLTGLIARGVDQNNVLPLAVYLHARAGDLAAQRKGQSGMRAGDIVEALPEVFRHMQGR
jgi:ADP-dependent NAD(P)H-hydrate dehydratase / NAD(P)H-hydrate epimerase